MTNNMTATMNLNAVKNGIEITFTEKPSDVVRTALKDAGFRWGGKLGYWFAKNTEARMALANELCKPAESKAEKKSKAQTKSESKAKAKAEPKAKAQTKSDKKASAKPKKAESVEIPTADEHVLKLGELSDKVAYTITCTNGCKTVKGYICTATLDNKKIKIGVHKAGKDSWTVSDLATGIAICRAEKRYLALAKVTPELMAKIQDAKQSKECKEIAANLRKYNKAHA